MSKKKIPPPKETKARGGLGPSKISILTVNARGTRKCVEKLKTGSFKLFKKYYNKKELIENKLNFVNVPTNDNTEKKSSFFTECKPELLLDFIVNNPDSNIVIIETKLSSINDSFVFRDTVKYFTNDNFNIFCNNLTLSNRPFPLSDKKERSKHGVS